MINNWEFIMANKTDKTDYRYVNDLRRLAYSQEKSIEQKKFLMQQLINNGFGWFFKYKKTTEL